MNCKNYSDDLMRSVAETTQKLIEQIYKIIDDNIIQDDFEIIIEAAETLVIDE